MANKIKDTGDGVALQVTEQARSAGLVKEGADGEPTDFSQTRVYAFDSLLLAIDVDVAMPEDVVELVTAAARDTTSIHRAWDATVTVAGGGYKLQLPPASDAGLRVGDRAPCQAAPNMLVIWKADGTSAATNAARLAADLVSIRQEQTQ